MAISDVLSRLDEIEQGEKTQAEAVGLLAQSAAAPQPVAKPPQESTLSTSDIIGVAERIGSMEQTEAERQKTVLDNTSAITKLADTAKTYAAGSGELLTQAGQAAEMLGRTKAVQSTPLMPEAVAGMDDDTFKKVSDTVTGMKPGQSIMQPAADMLKQAGKTTSDYWDESMSEGGQILNKTAWQDAPGAANKLHAAVLGAARSAPQTIGIGFAGKALTGLLPVAQAIPGVAKGLTRIGLPAPFAKKAAEWMATGAIYGSAEGISAGLSNAAQVGEDIDKMDFAKLAEKSPKFNEYLAQLDPSIPVAEREAIAKGMLKEDIENMALWATAGLSTVTGSIAGAGIFDKVLSSKRFLIDRALGGLKEAHQEFWQSGLGEKLPANLAMQQADQGIGAMDDVWHSAVAGAGPGAIMGLVAGGGGRHAQDKEDDSKGALERNLAAAQLERMNLPTRDLIAIRNGEFHKVPYAAEMMQNMGLTPEHVEGVLENRYNEMSAARATLERDINQGPLVRAATMSTIQAEDALAKDKARRNTQDEATKAAIDLLMGTYNPSAPKPTEKTGRAIWPAVDRTAATVEGIEDRKMEGEADAQADAAALHNKTRNTLLPKPGDVKTRDKTLTPPPSFDANSPAKRRAEEVAAFELALNRYDDTPENRAAWAGSEPAVRQEIEDRKMQGEWDAQEQAARDNLAGRFLTKEQQAPTAVQGKPDPLAKAKATFDESYNATGTVPESRGNVTDEEAAAFEKKVERERATQRRQAEIKAWKAREAEADTILKDEAVPEDVKSAAAQQAKEIAKSDPVYQHMAEAKKRGKINLDAMKEGYDSNTISMINRRYPGIFSLVGTVQPDDFASEMGYENLDAMINRFSEARTQKELVGQFVREKMDEWQRAEAEQGEFFQKQAERQDVLGYLGKSYTGKKTGTVFPAPEEAVASMEAMIKSRPDLFTEDDLDHWTYTADQQSRLRAAHREALSALEMSDNNKQAQQKISDVAQNATSVEREEGGVDEAGTVQQGVDRGKGTVAAGAQQGDGVQSGKEESEGVSQGAEEVGQSPVDQAAKEAAHSPENDLADPTDAQKEAGNYKKAHVKVHGLDISIENPAGSTRSGTDADGKRWETPMRDHYGYINGTVGKDKDHIDMFIPEGFDPGENDMVAVVDQVDPKTGKFDEHKTIVGVTDEQSAREAYLRNYDQTGASRIGAITLMPVKDFKEWLDSGNTKQPVGKISASQSAKNETQTGLPRTGETQNPTDKKSLTVEPQFQENAAIFPKQTAEESVVAQEGEATVSGAPTVQQEREVITDPAQVQEIRNSISEGMSILDTGEFNGKKRTPEYLEAVRRSVLNSKKRIGDTSPTPGVSSHGEMQQQPQEADSNQELPTEDAPESFVATEDGSEIFGEIDQEKSEKIGRQPGKIKLQSGNHDPKTGTGFGLKHVIAQHLDELHAAGYSSARSFIADVAGNYNEIRKGGKGGLLLVKKNGKDKVAVVRLTPAQDGDFYTVNSAYLSRDTGSKQLLWEVARDLPAAPGEQPAFARDTVTQPGGRSTPNAGKTISSADNISDDDKKGKLADFGEKLGGAKKDRTYGLSKELSDDDIATQPLSKIWPKSDIDAIEDNFIAALHAAARAEIPRKPRKGYALKSYVDKVKSLRNLSSKVSAKENPKQFMLDSIKRDYPTLEKFFDKVLLLESLPREYWDRIGQVAVYPNAYSYKRDENGNHTSEKIPKPHASIVIDDRHQDFKGATTIADTFQPVADFLAGKEAAEKKMQFEVRGRGTSFKVNKKGDPEYRTLGTFTSAEDAFAFIKSNYNDLVAEWDKIKANDNVKKTDVRRAENRPRVGTDRRNGKDVTPEMFTETFGFRGVEFGNWVTQGKNAKERQGMLNQAFDAFSDLADILNIPPKAISLNGTIGLGFGSRGSGWASAHYETSNIIINLTKTRGAGALAHEWFHALDNYFSRERNDGEIRVRNFEGPDAYRKANYVTYKPERMLVHKQHQNSVLSRHRLNELRKQHPGTSFYNAENWIPDPNHKEGIRPEVEEVFADLVNVLDSSPMAGRSRKADSKGSGYWSRIIERGARAFENYIISKMQQGGYHNDYLANVVEPESFGRDPERYPYLLPGEVQPVEDVFDALFSTIKTKQTDKGVALYEPQALYNGQPPLYATSTGLSQPGGVHYEVRQPRSGAKGMAGDGNRRSSVPVQTTIFSVLSGANAPGGPGKAQGHLESENVQVGTFRHDLETVSSPEDAAHILSPLAKQSQEVLLALVLDNQRRPVSVIRHSVGGPVSNQVFLGQLVGSIHNTEGATSVWFAHNHPGGAVKSSAQDDKLMRNMRNAISGTGVEIDGHLIIGSTGMSSAFATDGSMLKTFATPKTAGEKTVPVTERQLTGISPELIEDAPVTDTDDVVRVLKSVGGKSGVLLFNSQMQPVRFVNLSTDEMNNLRRGEKKGVAAELYRLIDRKNGAVFSVIAVEQGVANNHSDIQSAASNMVAFLNQAGAQVRDIIQGDKSTGTLFDVTEDARIGNNTFFSRTATPVPASNRADIEQEITSSLGGVRTRRLINSGRVVIVDSQQEMQRIIDGAYPGEGDHNDPARFSKLPDSRIPKKTVKAYKLFRTMKSRPGELFPLFIGKNEPTPVGEWIEAEFLPTKGFAPRPGWHAGVLPKAPHLMKKDGSMAEGRVWAEVEIPADVDWQQAADSTKTGDIRDRVPEGGSYRFKTSKLQGGAWIIGGAIKVNRILSSAEVDAINNSSAVKYSKDGAIQGAYVNGTAYLVRDGIEKGQAFPVLLHELGEHAGQLGFNSDSEYQSILKSLENRKDAKGATGDAIRAAMARVPASTKPEHYWSEVAAYLIENNANAKLTVFDWIMSFFKKLLVKAGLSSPDTLSHKDLVAFARAAVNAASGVSIREQAARFSKAMPQTATEAFKRWFGKSKVTKNGQPHILYHGTQHPQFLKDKEYPWVFDQNRPRNQASTDFAGLGIFLGDATIATAHAGWEGTVHPFYVRMENPYTTTSAELEKKLAASGPEAFRKRLQELNGHDGIIITDRGHAVVFEPNQVKSATGNTGSFSNENPDVRYSRSPLADVVGPDRAAAIEAIADGGYSAAAEQAYFKAMAKEGDDTVDVDDVALRTKAADWFRSLVPVVQRKTLGALTLRQLRDVFAGRLPQMEMFYQATRDQDVDAKKIMTKADEVYNKWAGLSKKAAKDMSELMIKATIGEVNPDIAQFEPRANSKALRQRIDANLARIAEINEELKGAGNVEKLNEEKVRLERSITRATEKIENEVRRFKAYQELAPMYRTLSKEAKAVYQDVKKLYTDNLESLYAALEERISRQVTDPRLRKETLDAIRLKYDRYLENGPYFPLSRFGEYLSVATKGGRREVRTFDTMAERTRYMRRRRREGWEVQAKTKRDFTRETAGASSGFVEGIFEILDGTKGIPGPQMESLKDQINQHFIKALPDLSHRKHFVHREKVEGYSRDQMRAFADNMQHAAHHIARIRHADKLETAVQSILQESKMMGKNQEGDEITDLYNELNARLKILNNPEISPVTQALTAAGFVMNIGPSIASALVNMSQTPLVAFPILATRFKQTGAISAMNAMTKATADYMSSKPRLESGPSLIDNKKLPQHERDMIQALIDDGTIDVTAAHSLAQAAGNDFFNMARTKHGHVAMRAMRLVSYPFHVAELANRKITALAAYRLALKNGFSQTDAIKEARESVLEGHFDYCVDQETECLTADGWKKYSELVPGKSNVFAVDDHGQMVASKLVDLHVFNDGNHQVTEFSNSNGFSMVVTPNHTNLVQTYDSKKKAWGHIKKVKTADLRNHHYVVRTPHGFVPDGHEQEIYTDDEVRLITWIAADGWYSKYRNCTEKNDVRIGQSETSKSGNPQELRELLARFGDIKEYTYDRTNKNCKDRFTTFVLPRNIGKIVQDAIPDKTLTFEFLRKLSHRQWALLLDLFLEIDGHQGKDGGRIIVQKSTINLECLQFIATAHGFSTSISQNGKYASLNVMSATKRSYVKEMTRKEAVVDMVWCPETAHGTWIARRNGRVFVTGNSGANRARWMEGNVRRVLLLFKQYSQQMTWLLGRSFYHAAKGESPEVKAMARKRLGMILGGHFLLAGTQGMPVLGGIMAAVQFLFSAFGDDDEPEDLEVSLRNLLADTVGEKAGEALASGPWRMIPGFGDIDLSSRVSLGDLWLRAPQREAEGRDKWNQYINLVLGPVATNAANIFAGASTMADGQVWRGMELMVPKFIKDAMKAVRYSQEGVKNWQEDTLMDNLGAMELFSQALGFTPANISEMYAGANAIKNHEERVNKRRQVLVNRWVQATRKNDAVAADEAMQDIVAFGAKQPAFGITNKSLRSSLENRMRIQQQTADGVYLPASKEEVRKIGRFANTR